LENHIYRDVLDLTDFDFTTFDFNDPRQVSYKENGIQFKNQNFSNKTFRINNDFIEKCKDKIQHNHVLTARDITIEIEFNNCNFSNIIIKEQVIHANILFDYNEQNTNFGIERFIIFGSTLIGKFYINKQYLGNSKTLTINSLKIENTVFNSNFKLHNTVLKEFNIEDTDFEKHADFFKSNFLKGTLRENEIEKINENDIGFRAINFKGLALFGDTEFNEKLIFKYVTFENFNHFRKAKLHKGLDLDYSNIQNEMNFFDVQKLDTKEAKNNTSQETYRIIKHNFEKIGNKIEANKYFAFELEQKKINLENNKSSQWTDYIVFQINWLSSEFGTNWLRVLGLICCIGALTVGFIHFELLRQLFFNPSLFKPEYIMKAVNEFFQYLYILNKSEALISHPATLLFNKITLGYLYYQFLISIRKDTRK